MKKKKNDQTSRLLKMPKNANKNQKIFFQFSGRKLFKKLKI